jgi:hypothetical protein
MNTQMPTAWRRKRGFRATTLAALLVGMLVGPAIGAGFQPPSGFNGHQWGETLAAYQGLTLWRADTALNSNGKLEDFRLNCRPDLPCAIDERTEGDGSYALGEYYFTKDTNPWVEQRIELFTVSYLFCARYLGDHLPRNLKEQMKLCGARIMFRSDTTQQLASLGDHYRSNFDKVMQQLVGEFGEPPGYERSARITIETDTQRVNPQDVPASDYVRYRWCGLDRDEQKLRPNCDATVTLVFDSGRGEGTILYAAGPLYDYAYARHDTGDAHNDIYTLLNGERLDQRPFYVKRECTGTHICGPQKGSMSKNDALAFQP